MKSKRSVLLIGYLLFAVGGGLITADYSRAGLTVAAAGFLVALSAIISGGLEVVSSSYRGRFALGLKISIGGIVLFGIGAITGEYSGFGRVFEILGGIALVLGLAIIAKVLYDERAP